ncbi:nucleoside deaminase [Agromyces sp. Root1464]|uniref:nucleoside deaminase n=1 Tax=Agromyces sp. Root1464 TaxID=1736467 RepID=UPI0009E9D1B4|nr:nucleoside deaminase [Agromyces sp. Root1464]
MDSLGLSTVTATDGKPATAQPAASPSTPAPTPADYLARAVAIATENVRNAGGPFGAIVVTADGRVFEGVNRVTANLDPTAHAEVSAIRAACQGTGSFDLSGATLYSSCEPCPMCLASSLWARIDSVHFAATRDDAADAGFDDAVFYRYFEGDAPDREIMPVSDIELPAAVRVAPFTEWRRTATRTEY